jgi:TonB family protein
MSKNAERVLALMLGIILLTSGLLPAEDLVIRVHLFQGTWPEGHRGLEEAVVFTAASHPSMQTLKTKAGAPPDELTARAIDALLESQALKTLDDVLSFEKRWNGSESRLSEAVSMENSSFLFIFTPVRLSPDTLRLRTVLFKSKEVGGTGQKGKVPTRDLWDVFLTGKVADSADIILETEPSLTIGEPVIIGVPSRRRGQGYFLMVLVSRGIGKAQPIEFAGGPRPLQKATPVYPDEFRRRGVEGQVELQVGVDEEGTVQGVKVLRSLHPYLDQAAVQALKRWKFEPVLQNGAPVPVIITTVVHFDREAYRQLEEAAAKEKPPAADSEPSPRAKLSTVLEKSAAYCQNLTDAALDYICEETIHDVFYNFITKEEMEKSGIVLSMVTGTGSVSQLGISFIASHNLKRTEKNEYVCDYLLVKKGDRIEDRRIILQENGRKLPDRTKLLEEKRLSTLLPFLAPVRLIGRERQPLFDYRLLKEEKAQGRDAYVIEAIPKTGDAGGIEFGKVWVERKNFHVLKIETTGVPLEGYESVLEEVIQYNLKPRFITTYAYQVENKGLAFPSSATIRVDYPRSPSTYFHIEKLRTTVKYDKYKFFTVETESGIKK